MENGINKYLHKKFKKQISELRNNQEENPKENNGNTTAQNTEKVSNVVHENINISEINCTNNNNSDVPKESTSTNKLFCNVNSSDKSSISSTTNAIKVNVIRKNEDSILQQQQQQQLQQQQCKEQEQSYMKSRDVQTISGDTTTNSQSTNGSISYIFSRVDGQIPVIIDNKDTNFDTNFKLTEPKQVDKSSTITQIIAQNNNVVLPLILTTSSVDKLEDISSNSSTKDISPNFETKIPSLFLNKTIQIINENNQVIEKSAGGKYVCPYCNLVCSKPSVLQKHIRAHTNERPYPCESCGSRFKTRSNLYKHCRSRTHANRVMGNKSLENNNDGDIDNQTKYEYYNMKNDNNEIRQSSKNETQENLNHDQISYAPVHDMKPKPYKPRFHTKSFYDNLTKENIQDDQKYTKNSNISSHINDLITKNHHIVNTSDSYFSNNVKNVYLNNENFATNNRNVPPVDDVYCVEQREQRINNEEPLNLSNKSRKRCLSEVAEPSTQKSLIKELLLKNLYASSDMQCPHCKMIFQTVTELDVHKHRSSCKGYTKSGARYSRSSSVNVASILTQNKNAFDGIPQLQESFFPLKSPGPFLGKTRLIESDKSKSFSFDDGIQNSQNDFFGNYKNLPNIPMLSDSAKRAPPVKLFGGEVKITHTSGETKRFKVDSKESENYLEIPANVDYGSKLSENTVVKSVLQSGGTVLQNKTTYSSNKKQQLVSPADTIQSYQNKSLSPNYQAETTKQHALNEMNAVQLSNNTVSSEASFNNKVTSEYTSIMDFSQKAVQSFTPNLKQLNLTIPGVPIPNVLPKPTEEPEQIIDMQFPSSGKEKVIDISSGGKDFRLHNPMTLLVNGKMVPYVPGMPGPITADVHFEPIYPNSIIQTQTIVPVPTVKITPAEITTKTQTVDEREQTESDDGNCKNVETATDLSPIKHKSVKSSAPNSTSPTNISTIADTPKKFARPNSLALKPTLASMKKHHGLTPTVFNQILISPDTPRVAKKCIEYQRNGYYFSSLGLKSSTKSVYCTLNKTQPFYVPHFKKLSMYSEWRQQDTKTDKLYVSAYDSRQMQQKYAMAGQICKPLVVDSSYKVINISTNTSSPQFTINIFQFSFFLFVCKSFYTGC